MTNSAFAQSNTNSVQHYFLSLANLPATKLVEIKNDFMTIPGVTAVEIFSTGICINFDLELSQMSWILDNVEMVLVKNSSLSENQKQVTNSINEVLNTTNARPQFGQVAIVRTDEDGRVGWSFEKVGVEAGDLVTLADAKTSAVVNYVRNH